MDRVAASVLIVDDHARFRATARRALERDGWRVVGEAADGESALRAVQMLEPDVVVLDVGLPDMSGLEVARHLRDRSPRLAVVVVSTRDSSDYRDLALANGARGFLAKADLTGAALAALL
jgi:DNA-binding NarL/FixJ family response regulator